METMAASLAEDAIRAASPALRPPLRAAFQQLVAAELNSLPCGMIGPNTTHRIIAAAQKASSLRLLAVAPSPKHGKSDAIRARVKAKRAC